MGDFVTMAPAVEVIVAGVKMAYPTCYVLVTDLDSAYKKTSTCPQANFDLKAAAVVADNMNEPSPFTSSNHPLLSDVDLPSGPASLLTLSDQAWQDGLTVNPESTLSSLEQQQTQYHQQSHQGPNPDGGPNPQQNLMTSDLVSAWDFAYPGRYVKKKLKSTRREKTSKDHRIRFNSKVPFHKKQESVDELTWSMDYVDISGLPGSGSHLTGLHNATPGSAVGGVNTNTNSVPSNAPTPNNQPGKSKAHQTSLVSPAPSGGPRSVGGPVTPVFTPKGSVRTPGGADLLSPHPPPSNGPLTPLDIDTKPSTPKSVPSYPIPSPFDKKPVLTPLGAGSGTTPGVPSQAPASNKSETMTSGLQIKSEPPDGTVPDEIFDPAASGRESAAGGAVGGTGNTPILPAAIKRPALPTKEYEDDLENEHLNMSETIFDTSSIR